MDVHVAPCDAGGPPTPPRPRASVRACTARPRRVLAPRCWVTAAIGVLVAGLCSVSPAPVLAAPTTSGDATPVAPSVLDLAVPRAWESVVDTSVSVPAHTMTSYQGKVEWDRVAGAVARGQAPESELHKYSYFAAQTGNMDSAESLMEYGVVPSVRRGIRAGSPLHAAAASGDVAAVRTLLDEPGADVDDRGDDGTTPLIVAAAAGHAAVVRLLVERGADVSAAGNNGMAALHVAASMAHDDVVRELLTAGGGDPDVRHRFADSTALHFAAEMDHPSTISLLCELGADVEAEKVTGGRPIHVASDTDHADCVRALVRAPCGASINPKLLGDTTPLYLAAQNGFEDVARALLDKGADADFEMPTKEETGTHMADPSMFGDDIDHLGNFGYEAGNGATALHAAVENGHVSIVRLLLQRGARQRGSMEGATPLYVAAEYNQPESTALLLDHGGDPNAPLPRDGARPLYVAAGAGHTRVMEVLLERGNANVDARTDLGATALFYAAGMGQTAAVATLLAHNADPTIATHTDGGTALHAAAERGHSQIAQLLIESLVKRSTAEEREGAYGPLDAKAGDDQTALHMACEGRRPAVALALIRGGANRNARVKSSRATPLVMAAKTGALDVVRELLRAGVDDVDAPATQYKATALYMAAQNGHIAVVSELLAAGASVNARLLIGVTPLFIAAERGHADVVRLLSSRGAKPDLHNQGGLTALHVVSEIGLTELVGVLAFEAGADVNAQRPATGEHALSTPLMDAARGNHADAVKLLLAAGADVTVRNADGDTAADVARHRRQFDVIKLLQDHADASVEAAGAAAADAADAKAHGDSGVVQAGADTANVDL